MSGMMERPRVEIALDTVDWIMEVLGLVFLLLMIGLPVYYFSELPEVIPQHFNAAGEPDGFSQKSIIWVLPAIGLMMYSSMWALNRYPHIFNYPTEITKDNAKRQYHIATKLIRTLNFIIAGSFVYIVYRTIRTALDGGNGLGISFLPVFLVLIFGTIGIYLYQAIRGPLTNQR